VATLVRMMGEGKVFSMNLPQCMLSHAGAFNEGVNQPAAALQL